MASANVLAPLCPSCLERVLAWTAAKCPACGKETSVSSCDACGQSRAGAFLPEDKARDGGATRFVCVGCMESVLEADVDDRIRDAMFAVALFVLSVRFPEWSNRWVTWGLLAATLYCFFAWGLAVRQKKRPANRAAGCWKAWRRKVERALARRPGGLKR